MPGQDSNQLLALSPPRRSRDWPMGGFEEYKGGSDIVTLPSSRRVDGIVSSDCVILGVVELEMSRHGGIRDDLRDSK